MNGKTTKYFVCPICRNGTFNKVFTFAVDFRNVNFTDELVYDYRNTAKYECRECGREYTEEEIKEGLKNTINIYKKEYWEDMIK